MAYHGVNLCLRTLVKYILLIQDYPEDPRAFGPKGTEVLQNLTKYF
uniref:Uncharacterized protein n=1 Tax=Anguilla anguilla TaxID=7936 RepID=A0A0E9SID1_ANGAN